MSAMELKPLCSASAPGERVPIQNSALLSGWQWPEVPAHVSRLKASELLALSEQAITDLLNACLLLPTSNSPEMDSPSGEDKTDQVTV
jgi:hypothetical protein